MCFSFEFGSNDAATIKYNNTQIVAIMKDKHRYYNSHSTTDFKINNRLRINIKNLYVL